MEPEDFADNSERKSNNYASLLFVFIILFCLVFGMLVYFQFYQGQGSWRFTLLHKSNDTTLLLSIKASDTNAAKRPKMVANTVKKDSTPLKTDTLVQNKTQIPTNLSDSAVHGTVYEVQIGTFENYELKKYNAVFNKLQEEKKGNLTKLTLGQFSSEKEANTFRKDLAKLGLKDAWVVKKVDGKRK